MNEWQERMGVGEPCHAFGRFAKGTTMSKPVRSDESGKVVGFQTEHKSGRVDATVTNPGITVNPNAKVVKDRSI